MSHIVTVRTVIRDLECLRKAAEKIGLEFIEGKKTARDYYGEDHLKCDHVLTVNGNKLIFEIGVIAKKDGSFTLQRDEYSNGRGMDKIVGNGCQKLLKEYGREVAEKHLTSMGFSFDVETNEAGEYVFNALSA